MTSLIEICDSYEKIQKRKYSRIHENHQLNNTPTTARKPISVIINQNEEMMNTFS